MTETEQKETILLFSLAIGKVKNMTLFQSG